MRKVYCTDFRVLVTFPRVSGNGFIKRSFFETIQTLQGFAGQRLSLSALSVPLLPQPQPRLQRQRLLLIGRLQRLQRLGLADEAQPGTWTVHNDAEKTLRWEEFYRSAPLREVIRLGLENNRDLRQAVLNVQAYRARYRIQHADLFPTLEAGADGSLQRLPADLSQTGQGHVFEQYGLDVGTTSYELDLFGRIRSLNSEAMQTYLASEQARRASQITLVANIAIAFLTLEIDRQRLDLSQRTLSNYEEALGLVERGLEVGTATELDRRQAATLVAQTQAEVQRGTRLVATDTNALRLLVGTTLPEGFD